jgi:hypothetical protein
MGIRMKGMVVQIVLIIICGCIQVSERVKPSHHPCGIANSEDECECKCWSCAMMTGSFHLYETLKTGRSFLPGVLHQDNTIPDLTSCLPFERRQQLRGTLLGCFSQYTMNTCVKAERYLRRC